MAKRRKKKNKKKSANHRRSCLLVLVAVGAILWGFTLPWLDYQCSDFDQTILGCPESQMVPGWRLPLFAREAEQAWIVRAAQVFSSSEPDRARAWLVYASPLAAVLSLGLLVKKKFALPSLFIAAFNAILFIALLIRLTQPLGQPPLPGVSINYGVGPLLSTAGHGVMVAAALIRFLGQLSRR